MRGLNYETGFAEVDAEAVLTLAPPVTEPADELVRAGSVALAAGERVAAVTAFTRAVIADPALFAAYEGLGASLLRAGRTTESAAALRSALVRDPSSLTARRELAVTAQRIGRDEEAAAQWRELLLRNPAHPEARVRLAVLLYYLEDYTGAWAEIHAVELAGGQVPPQLRVLLAEQMPEPP